MGRKRSVNHNILHFGLVRGSEDEEEHVLSNGHEEVMLLLLNLVVGMLILMLMRMLRMMSVRRRRRVTSKTSGSSRMVCFSMAGCEKRVKCDNTGCCCIACHITVIVPVSQSAHVASYGLVFM